MMKNGKESTSASALSIQSVILIPLIRFSLLAYCILTNTVQFSLIVFVKKLNYFEIQYYCIYYILKATNNGVFAGVFAVLGAATVGILTQTRRAIRQI